MAVAGTLVSQKAQDAVALQPSAAQTATGNSGTGIYIPRPENGLVMELDVTVAGTGANDTLDVYVRTQEDGSNWVDVQHFTQIVGNGGTKRYFAKITVAVAATEFENGASLGAATVRAIFGDLWGCRWTIASGTNASFTFSVWLRPM